MKLNLIQKWLRIEKINLNIGASDGNIRLKPLFIITCHLLGL